MELAITIVIVKKLLGSHSLVPFVLLKVLVVAPSFPIVFFLFLSGSFAFDPLTVEIVEPLGSVLHFNVYIELKSTISFPSYLLCLQYNFTFCGSCI